MASVLEICNLALTTVGDRAVTALTGSVPADACARHYEPARDYVLTEYPWNGITKRAKLVQVPGPVKDLLFVAAVGAWIAVGDDGLVITSRDNGITWDQQKSGTAEDLAGVALHSTTLIVVGAKGTILTSTDYGTTWTARTSGTSKDLRAVASDGTNMVAAGRGGVILSSGDGTTWTARTSGVTTTLNGVTKSSGTWVTVGVRGVILSSTDLAAWTARTSGVTTDLNAVKYGAAFVAVGSAGVILTSADGTTWAAQTSGTTSNLLRVVYHNAKYLAGGAAGLVLYSADSSTWAAVQTGGAEDVAGVGFASDDYTYLACGSGECYSSTDLATWTQRESEPVFGFAYAFVVPGDCLRVWSVSNSDVDRWDDTMSWAREGLFLVADDTEVYARYSAKITDTERYSRPLADTIAANLAWRLAVNLVRSESLAARKFQDYKDIRDASELIDAIENAQDREQAHYSFKTARY